MREASKPLQEGSNDLPTVSERLMSMLDRLRAARSEESGFTLVELLVVIAILGVLAGVVVFSVAGIQDNSQKSACQTEAQTVRTAEEANYAKNKEYASGATLVTNKFLNAAPTLVTITTTGTPPSAYSLAWASTTCSGIAGIGNP